MSTIHAPRRGSMQYSPRKRASRPYARVRSWPDSDEIKPLGFAGYKAGMTHVFSVDHRENTATSNVEVLTPVTIIECPPMTVFSIKSYKKTPYGFKSAGQIFAPSLSKDLPRKISVPKSSSKKQELTGDEVVLLVHTNPRNVDSVPKKKPEIMEVKVGGKTIEEKINYAKELLGKDIKVSDIFKNGDFIDTVAVTKGKGTQGPVKRFGVKIQRRKAANSGKGRHVGTLGNRSHATRWTVPMSGQMGYHTRTEYNKRILKLGTAEDVIIPNGGFVNYGNVKNDYIMLKGSVPGSTKRLIRFRSAIRNPPELKEPEITYVSTTSNIGR